MTYAKLRKMQEVIANPMYMGDDRTVFWGSSQIDPGSTGGVIKTVAAGKKLFVTYAMLTLEATANAAVEAQFQLRIAPWAISPVLYLTIKPISVTAVGTFRGDNTANATLNPAIQLNAGDKIEINKTSANCYARWSCHGYEMNVA